MLNLSSGLRSCLEINFSLTEASCSIKDCLHFFVIACVELRSLELELVEFSSSHKVGKGGDEGKMYSRLVEELHKELLTRGAGFTSSSRLFDQIEGGVDAEGSEHPGQGKTSPSWIVGRQAKVGCQIR